MKSRITREDVDALRECVNASPRIEAHSAFQKLEAAHGDLPPRHSFELTITVGSCSWETVLREVERLGWHVRDCGEECNLASGGPDCASSISIVKRDGVTRESYAAELQAWLERRPLTEVAR